jgi:NitT/TauT family transport system substrate-binding protein
MPENAAALRDGRYDVVQLFQPFAEDLIASGAGHIWYAQASRGPCSYTDFYAPRATLENRSDEILRMTRAMYRAQKWLHARPAAEIVGAVAGFFPDVRPEILTACVGRYLALDIWAKNPLPPRDGFQRLHDGMLSGGLIGKAVSYDDCVETRFAEQAIREDPPAL